MTAQLRAQPRLLIRLVLATTIFLLPIDRAYAAPPEILHVSVDHDAQTITATGHNFGLAIGRAVLSGSRGSVDVELVVISWSVNQVTASLPESTPEGTYRLAIVTNGNGRDPGGSDMIDVTLAWRSTGPRGPEGLQGVRGLAGPQGLQGPAGLPGPTGPAGAPGAQGAIGPIGPQGPMGPQGMPGSQGAEGPTGAGFQWKGVWDSQAQYVSGDVVDHNGSSFVTEESIAGNEPPNAPWQLVAASGRDGVAGPAGPTGLPGSDGVPGAMGPIGPQGEMGPVGPQGAIGPVGPQGGVGPVGPQGAVGITGPAGPEGAVGAQGAIGLQGPAGPQGPAGLQGPSGLQGPAGLQGPVGSPGLPGSPGPPGPAATVASTSMALTALTLNGTLQVVPSTVAMTVPSGASVSALVIAEGDFFMSAGPGAQGVIELHLLIDGLVVRTLRVSAVNSNIGSAPSAWHLSTIQTLGAGVHDFHVEGRTVVTTGASAVMDSVPGNLSVALLRQ